LELIGQNRTACVILDDGSYSRNFDLGRGRAQGDNISPNTFNFGEQILIFKLELDPGIRSIRDNILNRGQQPINLRNNFFMYESGRETDKVESLADDTTIITRFESASLIRIRGILDDFGKVSGLRCNYDKTTVMPVGLLNNVNVDTAGFSVSNRIKLLGLSLSAGLDTFDNAFTEIREKINSLILFWERFRLSLPGRIAVLKTLLIPQLNYLGCFLTPSNEILTSIQDLMDRFVTKNINISKDRRYLPIDKGGLGLFDINKFLDAQRCSWIQRARSLRIDNWRYDLCVLAPDNNITLIRPCDIDKAHHPILFNIATSYCSFVSEFTKINLNFRTVPVVDNPAIVRGPNDQRTLNRFFFGLDFYNAHRAVLRKLTLNDCYVGNRFKTMEEFGNIGAPLTPVIWMRLQLSLINLNRDLFNPQLSWPTLPGTLDGFHDTVRRGSKQFSKIIQFRSASTYKIDESTSVATFCNLINVAIPSAVTLSTTNGGWSFSFLPNDFREFIFLERNNFLKTGNRAANYVANLDERCSFCRVINPQTLVRETFFHLFFSCPTTCLLLRGMTRLGGHLYSPDENLFIEKYWFGSIDGKPTVPLILIYEIFRYVIWKFKLRRIVPTQINFFENFVSCLRQIKLLRPGFFDTFLIHFNRDTILQALG
jgi:hypothetical protein